MRGFKVFWGRIKRRLRIALFINNLHQVLLEICGLLIPIVAFLGISLVIYDFGFKPFWRNSPTVLLWGQIILNALVVLLGARLFLRLFISKKRWSRIFNLVGWLFISFLAFYILPAKASLTVYDSNTFLLYKLLLYVGLVFTFITETSYLLQFIYNRAVSPALLFVGSFALLIVIGTFLLKSFFSEAIQTESGEEVSNKEVKKILEDCIGKEDKRKPLADEKLTEILKEQGYNIARRTVAKYREQMNIPVARLRKEL